MSADLTNLTLKIWRQAGPDVEGHFESYRIDSISAEASFLELLDVLNERLISEGQEAVVFDHDCREGICGSCSLMIDGQAHGPQRGTATCQLHMRKFPDGQEIVVEPWRATAFPIIKDLMCDRGASTASSRRWLHHRPHRRRARRQPHPDPEGGRRLGDGRGRVHRMWCVCGRVPQRRGQPVHRGQGQPISTCCPRDRPSAHSRVEAMVETMDEYFGSCTNHGECEAACPKRSRSTSSP